MSESLPSDHPTIDSYRVQLGRLGSTNRPQLVLPADLSCDAGAFVRLSLSGRQTHARVVSTLSDEPAIRSAHANRQLARTGDGANLLGEWLDDRGYGPGSTLVLDVVTEGYAYGLREPGARVLYQPLEKPDSSLASIAESLEESTTSAEHDDERRV